MKKGFDRLRGVAAASAIGVGLLGGGSARAVTVTDTAERYQGECRLEQVSVIRASTSLYG